MKISEITQQGWLFEDDDKRVGIISKKNTGEYVIVRDKEVLEFPTMTTLNEYLNMNGGIHPNQPREKHDVEHYILGYPVNYPDPILVDAEGILPLFRKRDNTRVNLCAGYYVVRTPKGWRTVFCPKETTLNKYQWKGPFRTPPTK